MVVIILITKMIHDIEGGSCPLFPIRSWLRSHSASSQWNSGTVEQWQHASDYSDTTPAGVTIDQDGLLKLCATRVTGRNLA